MSQSIPDRQSQEQDNLIKDTNVSGDLIFAPVQIGTKIETQIVQISVSKVTQQPLIKNSPYQGLKRFNVKDRDRFFGRDKLIARLFEAVNRSNLSLVLGASGSGKSSVVRAGLIPELEKSLESQTFYNFIFTPNQDPFESLHRCLLSEEKNYNFSKSDAKIALEAKANTLKEVIRTLRNDGERWLIFVDQFEELFTICDDPDKRKNFISGLVEVAKFGDSSVKIVLAMRADFLEQFSFYPDLGAIANQNNIHLVTEMFPDELRQAIEQPAAKHGVVFEEGLVEQIIKELDGQKGYLPLLQYTLNLLWESECQTLGADGRPNIEDRTLNKKSYAALEGVRGALQKRVNKIYSNLNQDEQTTTKQMFLKLVNVVDTDSGSRAVSRRAYRDEFVSESVEKLLIKFIGENLLVGSSEYSNPEEIQASNSKRLKQSATVEIAHEILLSSWDELKRWLEQEKDAIILKNWLAGETRRWQKIGLEDESKAQDELLKGYQLAKAVELRKNDAFKNLGGLRPEESEFIDASVEWQERIEQEKEARRRREIKTAWGIAAGSLVAVVVSSGLGLMAWKQTRQSQLILADSLGQYSLSLFDKGKELEAFVEAIKAGKILQKPFIWGKNSQVMSGLQNALYHRSQRNLLEGHYNDVYSVSVSPDGKTLASGSWDNTIKLWNLETGKEIRTPTNMRHDESVLSVSFSPDGKTLATGSADDTIKLWNVKTGEEIGTLKGHKWGVWSVSFSPDGKTLASGSTDRTIKLWNVETGTKIQTPTKMTHEEIVYSVSFSPDGKTLASGSKDRTIKLWNVETGTEIQTPTKMTHEEIVWSVSFSPDGKTLASGSDDKTIKLWNVETGTEIQTPTKMTHDKYVYSVSFSKDGKTLASGSGDKTIKLWDVNTGKEIRILKGHTDRVRSVSFSPDGKNLASGSQDSTIILWDLETRKELGILKGHTNRVRSVSFSPDGKNLASGSQDSTIILWDVKTRTKIHEGNKNLRCNDCAGKNRYVNSVSFSPDGKTLATGSEDKTIKLWNVETGTEIQTNMRHDKPVNSVSFSPDGKTLATGSEDKTIKLWNVETGTEIQTNMRHDKPVNSVSFSPDGKTLASGSLDNTIKLWNLETGKEIHTLKGHKGVVYSVSFSPDGKTLASGSLDNTIKLWNVETRTEILTNMRHDNAVRSVSFSHDGKTLASGSSDNTIKLWDVKTREEIIALKKNDNEHNEVYSVSFSPDDKTLVSGNQDSTVELWNLDLLKLDPLMGRSCDWVRAYLENNINVRKEDRLLCDGIGTQK